MAERARRKREPSDLEDGRSFRAATFARQNALVGGNIDRPIVTHRVD
jgi:hypothetical protein